MTILLSLHSFNSLNHVFKLSTAREKSFRFEPISFDSLYGSLKMRVVWRKSIWCILKYEEGVGARKLRVRAN
jgi:hypothetical protein